MIIRTIIGSQNYQLKWIFRNCLKLVMNQAMMLMSYWSRMTQLKENIYSKKKVNIDKAQEKYKHYYDRKHINREVRGIEVLSSTA